KNYTRKAGPIDYYPDKSEFTVRWTVPDDDGSPPSRIEKYEYGIDGITDSISDENAKIPISVNIDEEELRRVGEQLPDDLQKPDSQSDSQFSQGGDNDQQEPAYTRRTDVTANRGFHTFEIRAVDEAGNKGPIKTVTLCVIERDCDTPAEKKQQQEEVEEAVKAQEALEDFGEMGPGGDEPCRICDPGIPGWLADDERVNIYVEGAGGDGGANPDPRPTYHARIKNGKIQELAESKIDDPSMKVVLDKETLKKITSSEKPSETIMKEYNEGDIHVQGVGVVNRIKFGMAKTLGGIYDFGTDLVGAVPGL
ncbi:MAG: hypothetical protein SXQ77_12300, partial [Halobacteria archaeon]|nr:hypothetical protein [Halobacteria archaeon]